MSHDHPIHATSPRPPTTEEHVPSTSSSSYADAASAAMTRHHHHQTDALTPLQKWAARASESQFNAIAGALGGFTSGVVTCPLDVIKTKLQAQGAIAAANKVAPQRVYSGLIGTASVIWREEGIRGMYRGLGPIVLGYLPTWAVWFTVYNKSKVYLADYHRKHTHRHMYMCTPD